MWLQWPPVRYCWEHGSFMPWGLRDMESCKMKWAEMTDLFWSLEIWWKSNKIDVFPSHSIWNIWGRPGSQRGPVESSQASWHPRQAEKSAGPDFHPSHPSHPPAIGSNFPTISTTSHYHSLNYPLMLVKNKKPAIVWWFTIDCHPLPSTPGWWLWTEPGRRWWGRTAGTSNRSNPFRWCGWEAWGGTVELFSFPSIPIRLKMGGRFQKEDLDLLQPKASVPGAATSGQHNPQLHRCAIL